MSVLQSIAGRLKRTAAALFGPAPAASEAEGDAAKTDGDTTASATPPSAGPSTAALTTAIKGVRATSRTIVAGFSAVAALVVGTASLDKLGDLEAGSWQFWLAIVAVVAVI